MAAGRAAAACGASAGTAATSMEEKGLTGSCRRERLGCSAAIRVSSIDLDRATAAYVRAGGERPSGAAHVDR